MTLDNLFSKLKAQGFYGHAGRPGKRGGSLPKGGSSGMNSDAGIAKHVRKVQEIFEKAKYPVANTGTTEERLGIRNLRELTDPDSKKAVDHWYRGLITEDELASRLGKTDAYAQGLASEIKKQAPGVGGFLAAEARYSKPNEWTSFTSMSEQDAEMWGQASRLTLVSNRGGDVKLSDLGREVGRHTRL